MRTSHHSATIHSHRRRQTDTGIITIDRAAGNTSHRHVIPNVVVVTAVTPACVQYSTPKNIYYNSIQSSPFRIVSSPLRNPWRKARWPGRHCHGLNRTDNTANSVSFATPRTAERKQYVATYSKKTTDYRKTYKRSPCIPRNISHD